MLAQRDAELTELRAVVAGPDGGVGGAGRGVAGSGGSELVELFQAPSSDPPYSKGKNRRLRGVSGRRPGQQPGSEGTTLGQVDEPDEVVVCGLGHCPDGGRPLADAPVVRMTRRQVFDAPPPPPRPQVTEYQLITRCWR